MSPSLADTCVVIYFSVTRSIISHCKGHLGDCNADGVGQALSQGTGSRFDARCIAEFRMARSSTSTLAEPLEFHERQVEIHDME